MRAEREYVSFPAQTVDLIERAAEAHGGWEWWAKLRSVTFSVKAFGGPLPWIKGARPNPEAIHVFPHEHRTTFVGFPARDQEIVFEDGDVSIVPRVGGDAIERSPGHRDTFAGLRKYRRWSALDVAYFFGYAFVTYMSVPFLLKHLTFIGEATWEHNGRTSRGVTVEFPAGFDTHSPRQTFYFDENGLLDRHDYTGDVIGPFAWGAHFTEGYERVDGIPFATKRRVVLALAGRPTRVPVLHATLGDFRWDCR